ncbi:MAG: site-specific integrase [Bacteroidetes bacterium]|nr:site-specific integrase [Bacteroidota bacterium]
MSISTKIYLRSDASRGTRKSGLLPIYLRVIINRRKKEYFLNLEIPKDLWDAEGCIVKRNTKFPYQDMNAILSVAKMKIGKIVLDTRLSDRNITLIEFDRLFSRKTFDDGSFYAYAENFLAENKHKFASETIRTYTSQITKMKQFRPELKLEDLDESFLLQYERYILGTLKNKTNTHYKSMGFIKTVYHHALEDGLVKEGIFKKFPLTKKEGNREHLNKEELKKLENLLDKKLIPYQLNVLHYFLFSCYTGLRYRDMKNLSFNNIVGENSMVQLEMHKTKEIIKIPLTPRAKKLIGEGFQNQKVFRVATNQVTNRYLKELMNIAEIHKIISFHSARHTFATCSIDFGIPIEVISKLLGHKKIATTQIYAKIMDSVKIREMEKWNV